MIVRLMMAITKSLMSLISQMKGMRRTMFNGGNNNRTMHHQRLRRMIEALRAELTVQGILGQGTTTDLRVDIVSLAETALMVCDVDRVYD
jgi:hypothetical protein